MYKLRITKNDFSELQFNKEVEKMESKYFKSFYRVTEHKDTNYHNHWFFTTEYKDNTVRQYINRTFGKGNKSYSLKQVEPSEGSEYPIEWLAYMMKDLNLDSIPVSRGIPESVIQVAAEYQKEFKKKTTKDPKSKMQDIEDYIQTFKGEYDGENYVMHLVLTDKYKLASLIGRYYQELNGGLIRMHQVQTMYDSIKLKYSWDENFSILIKL